MSDNIQAADEPTLIAYYCRECKKVVKGKSKNPKSKYTFLCPECGGVCSYGSAKSIINFHKIKESSENGQILLKMQQEKLEELENNAKLK